MSNAKRQRRREDLYARLAHLNELKQTVASIEGQLQPLIREFVTDKKNIGVGERFALWDLYAEKGYLRDIAGLGDGDILERLIHGDCPERFERGSTYGWRFFMDIFEEGEDESLLFSFGMTLCELQEYLIDKNFGFFTYDR